MSGRREPQKRPRHRPRRLVALPGERDDGPAGQLVDPERQRLRRHPAGGLVDPVLVVLRAGRHIRRRRPRTGCAGAPAGVLLGAPRRRRLWPQDLRTLPNMLTTFPLWLHALTVHLPLPNVELEIRRQKGDAHGEALSSGSSEIRRLRPGEGRSRRSTGSPRRTSSPGTSPAPWNSPCTAPTPCPASADCSRETAELTERTQKRYDDTSLLLDAVVEHGFGSDEGRTAIRRINQMHRSYDISNDDMRYVLCTFVVMPKRWIDAYGWRRLSRHETSPPPSTTARWAGTWASRTSRRPTRSSRRCLDAYEAAHFAWDEGARQGLGRHARPDGLLVPARPRARAAHRDPRPARRLAAAGLPLRAAERRHPRGGAAAPSGCAAAPSGCCRRGAPRTTPARTGRSRATRTATVGGLGTARCRASGLPGAAPARQRPPPASAGVSRSR